MAQLCGLPGVVSVKTEGECSDIVWSAELDHVPLIRRRKLLLETKNRIVPTRPKGNAIVKSEDGIYDSQVLPSLNPTSAVSERRPQKSIRQQTCENKISLVDVSEDAHESLVDSGAVHRCSEILIGQDLVMHEDCNSQSTKENLIITSYQSSLGDNRSGSSSADKQAPNLKDNIPNDVADDLDLMALKERQKMFLARRIIKSTKPELQGMFMEMNSCARLDSAPTTFQSITGSNPLETAKVKDEPVENNGLHTSLSSAVGKILDVLPVKGELENPGKLYEDQIDHMQLQDRMKLPVTEDPEIDISEKFECSSDGVTSAVVHGAASLEVPPIRTGQPRKRRKTATDSVETALQEDAPGLLQVLIEQGVVLNEIKLYGETEIDEAIDESFIEDSFTELEAIMSKLFAQRSAILKLAPMRCTKASKPNYCLDCLFSLVEQTRYLQFRNWPAEWGWCRDLQSFIFVFERHNRIVLERPEYGYATYFFELLDSLPINWQIKRLMTAMKLTSCGRISIIENKALLVGEDLSEGEARVLMMYGWTPNTGLGSMLNYRDRVVHDRKNEKERSEWRSKIRKLLMDGYNGGTISSSTNNQINGIEYSGDQSSEIKTELC